MTYMQNISLANFKKHSNCVCHIPVFCRDRNTQINEYVEHSRGPRDKNADADLDGTVERVPEDLAGRVCYELEPLVFE